MIRNTDHLTWVTEHMPDESAAALVTFTEQNPHWRGAHWDDCLDVLIDCDAFIEVTEPIFDLMTGPEWAPFPPILTSSIIITLMLSSKQFCEASLGEKVIMVKATIYNNGGWAS